MLELLISYLYTHTTPQYLAEAIGLIKCFYAVGVKSFETDIIYLLKDAQNTDSNEILARLQNILVDKAAEILMAQGVTITTRDISVLRHTLEGLDAIQTYEDTDAVCMICESGLDTVETLCELLALVTPLPATTFHEYVAYVDQKVIDVLHARAETDSNMVVAAQATANESLKTRIQRWIKIFPDSLLEQFLLRAIQVGLSVDTYVTMIRQNLVLSTDVVFSDNPEIVAQNCISLVLYSDIPDDKVRESVQDLLDGFYSDLTFIQKADIAVDKLLGSTGLMVASGA